MTLEEIKQAVDNGQKVHWSNLAYQVVKGKNGEYLIYYSGRPENWIGLTWKDGKTLNGREEEFFMLDMKYVVLVTDLEKEALYIDGELVLNNDPDLSVRDVMNIVKWPFRFYSLYANNTGILEDFNYAWPKKLIDLLQINIQPLFYQGDLEIHKDGKYSRLEGFDLEELIRICNQNKP